MSFTYTHTDFFYPGGIESKVEFEAAFEPIYEDGIYIGDEVEISAIQINGNPVQSFGTSADWRKFLDVLRQAARDQANAQRVRIELSDCIGDMNVLVVHEMRVAA